MSRICLTLDYLPLKHICFLHPDSSCNSKLGILPSHANPSAALDFIPDIQRGSCSSIVSFLYSVLVDHCFCFCHFSIDLCIVCPSLIYWLLITPLGCSNCFLITVSGQFVCVLLILLCKNVNYRISVAGIDDHKILIYCIVVSSANNIISLSALQDFLIVILLEIMRFVCVKTNLITLNSCLSSIQIPKCICKLPVLFSVEDRILILSYYQYFIILYGARNNLFAISLV